MQGAASCGFNRIIKLARSCFKKNIPSNEVFMVSTDEWALASRVLNVIKGQSLCVFVWNNLSTGNCVS